MQFLGYNAPVIRERTPIVFAQYFSSEEKALFETHFYCPKCDVRRPYRVKPASVDFTFYYIPLCPVRNIPYFVVCEVCKKGFDPDILKLYNQNLLKIVAAAKRDLHNRSPEELKAALLRDRLKEEFIDKMIALAQC